MLLKYHDAEGQVHEGVVLRTVGQCVLVEKRSTDDRGLVQVHTDLISIHTACDPDSFRQAHRIGGGDPSDLSG